MDFANAMLLTSDCWHYAVQGFSSVRAYTTIIMANDCAHQCWDPFPFWHCRTDPELVPAEANKVLTLQFMAFVFTSFSMAFMNVSYANEICLMQQALDI